MRKFQLWRLVSRSVSTRFGSFLDERSSLGANSKRECFPLGRCFENTHVEATLNHPFPALRIADGVERATVARVAQGVQDAPHDALGVHVVRVDALGDALLDVVGANGRRRPLCPRAVLGDGDGLDERADVREPGRVPVLVEAVDILGPRTRRRRRRRGRGGTRRARCSLCGNQTRQDTFDISPNPNQCS